MVDTEREKSSTWRYVLGTIKPRLADVGVDLVIIQKSEYATVDLYSLKSHDLLIPAYTSEGGKMSTFCSNEWKSRVIDRYLRKHGVGPHDSVQWLGFSVNEMSRIRAGRYRYPLVLEFPMDRGGCARYVVSCGWDAPPEGGSACWMCPQMSHRQWLQMRENEPEDFARAVTFDVEIRLEDPDVFVHRNGRPLSELVYVRRKFRTGKTIRLRLWSLHGLGPLRNLRRFLNPQNLLTSSHYRFSICCYTDRARYLR